MTICVADTTSNLWNNPRTGWALLSVFCALAIRWLLETPSPGKAVAALAVVATVMTLRENLSGLEKTSLTLLLFVLVFIEIKAIDKDRAENQAQQKAFFQAQQKSFNDITTQAGQNFASTTQGLTTSINGMNTVLGTTQSVAKLAKDDLESVTGGNRVVALEITPSLTQKDMGTAFVFAPDRGIVRNVQVRVVNLALFDEDVKQKRPPELGGISAHDMYFDVGDLGPGLGKDLKPPIALGPGDFVRFNIFFSGLNGAWIENLYMRKKNGYWREAFRVFRKKTKLMSQTDRDVVYKQIGEAFFGRE